MTDQENMPEVEQSTEADQSPIEGRPIPGLEGIESMPEGTGDLDLSALQNMSFNRKFRKMLLKQSGYTKLKNRLGYKDWFENVRNNIKNGKQLHISNTEEVIKNRQSWMEKKNESIAEFLVGRGHSEETVAEIVQKNMDIQESIEMKKIKR